MDELDGLELPPPPTVERLSPGVKLTGKRRDMIARGEHPVTHRALIRVTVGNEDDTRTCGDCGHRVRKVSGGFTGSKCDVVANMYQDGPDVVQKWPACVLWIPEPNK